MTLSVPRALQIPDVRTATAGLSEMLLFASLETLEALQLVAVAKC